MWQRAVLDEDIGLHYEMIEDVDNMSLDYRNMLSKIGVFDNSIKYDKDAVFSALVGSLIEHTQRFLDENGYDVFKLLNKGSDLDIF